MRCVLYTTGLLLGTGCASAWDNYGPSLYTVLREPSVETATRHLELLERIIENAKQAGVRPPPGIQAEHAYYARRLGRNQQAKESLEAEARDYPEARRFLEVLARHLEAVTPITNTRQEGQEEAGR